MNETVTEPGSTDSFSFVEAEHAVLRFWQQEDVFQKSLQQTRDCKPSGIR